MRCGMFIRHYDSPLGRILLAADERGLLGEANAEARCLAAEYLRL